MIITLIFFFDFLAEILMMLIILKYNVIIFVELRNLKMI